MPSSSAPLSADSSIATWLEHPVGGPLMRELLAQGGQDADALRPVRRLALKRLVLLSKGQFPAELVEQLVARAAAGEVPAGSGSGEAGSAAGGAGASGSSGTAGDSGGAGGAGDLGSTEEGLVPVERPEWVERLDGGRFAGQTVIVTGAGSGIGRATASRIAREGGRVIAVDISAERLDDFAASLPEADITPVAGDITSDEAVAAIVSAAGERIDGLANVAGIMDDMTPVGEVTDEVWNRVFAINVTGTMKLTRAVIPAMLARGAGSIVNVASEAALRGSAAGAAYTASKHAVAGLTKSTAFMYGPSGIRANAVAPGPTITNIEARFASPLGAERVRQAMAILPDAVEADALAASITFLLSDDGVNVNGAILPSDGGWSAA
ncbi:SDR family NAD(P)-dependent oxidoreductase [Herbiconiux flava]|uniref:NAD(P)-dependent dehydrogenase (Short-subunit alcohol dehydrogenase family) n=1 Tax=Herbiconiux flava TaxID=881268 RepID=A0A852SMQ9_9MICO|nr:SDR family NAD(P)-dependent oxidoreductase [Herbiconiux flava]NYD70090.1 NAD(P)-dependent dehydrogenase (short-subunit alcohol dehydrogenase family) [Herbiconiux flava]